MNAKGYSIALMFCASFAEAQGFAGLGTDAEGFAMPDAGYEFEFPTDHGPHPAYRIEWWYLTANLDGADGQTYGMQWTLFRSALAPTEGDGWSSPQIWFGHAALTTKTAHFAAERFARGGIGQAGVTAEPFEAWIDDWRLSGPSLSDVSLRAGGEEFGYDLTLKTDAPFVPQGENGYSVKAASGQASHYYSQPFYEVSGTLALPDGQVEVTGQGWLDREWSSELLARSQEGWDWFSLHLGGGARLMGFVLRDDAAGDYTSATWIAPDGTPTPYPDGAFTAEPLRAAEVAGRDIPVRWRLKLPGQALDVEVTAVNEQAWNPLAFPYWEGPVTVTGSHAGRGYLEMTGYE
ncbi:lipocalin-like domain-containing protein [Anianabacter salinae]|uniref:lipocalin-like domain-containing protein n=1 Tax=Anianabacter salinae TaxID=2851023 RepID=UPI00225E0A13|nr:lipocalin-like domain-containing protein [Anianabacter salinae]MBV0912387.1 iron ABC transporter permease [Anianabacter salinae]